MGRGKPCVVAGDCASQFCAQVRRLGVRRGETRTRRHTGAPSDFALEEMAPAQTRRGTLMTTPRSSTGCTCARLHAATAYPPSCWPLGGRQRMRRYMSSATAALWGRRGPHIAPEGWWNGTSTYFPSPAVCRWHWYRGDRSANVARSSSSYARRPWTSVQRSATVVVPVFPPIASPWAPSRPRETTTNGGRACCWQVPTSDRLPISLRFGHWRGLCWTTTPRHRPSWQCFGSMWMNMHGPPWLG